MTRSDEFPIGHATVWIPIAFGIAFAFGVTLIIEMSKAGLQSFVTVGPTRPFQYPWRLVEPHPLSHLSAWLGYALHNVSAWILIAAARRSSGGEFESRFRWFNWAMFVVHSNFIGLHWIQSHIWYDGLAQDVPEVTALGSVALMLMVILILETPRRGLFFGQSFPFHKRFLIIVCEYHGYLFTWALIYTFWFHPTEGSPGHLVGFFYLFMLLWQSVLVFHQAHLNRWWKLLLELLVIPHSVVVAYVQGKGLCPMFVFGFLGVFVLTQMHGLAWQSWLQRLIYASFVVGTVAVYALTNRISKIHEVLRIPVLDYAVVFLLYGLFLLLNSRLPPRSTG